MRKTINKTGKFRYMVEVESLNGECDYSHKVGDTFILDGFSTPEGLCGGAYWILYPAVCTIESGAIFNDTQEDVCMSGLACPHNGNIKLKLIKLKD